MYGASGGGEQPWRGYDELCLRSKTVARIAHLIKFLASFARLGANDATREIRMLPLFTISTRPSSYTYQYPPDPDPEDPPELPVPWDELDPAPCPVEPDPFFLGDIEYESSLPDVPFPVVSVVPSP